MILTILIPTLLTRGSLNKTSVSTKISNIMQKTTRFEHGVFTSTLSSDSIASALNCELLQSDDRFSLQWFIVLRWLMTGPGVGLILPNHGLQKSTEF